MNQPDYNRIRHCRMHFVITYLLLSVLLLQSAQAQMAAPLLFFDNGKVGYKDATGKTIIAPQFGIAGRFSEGLANALLPESGKFGFINTKGEWQIAAAYSAAGDFSEGLARVQQLGKWGYIDATGNWLIPAQFQLCYEFSAGHAIAQKAGKWGIINKKGEWVVAANMYDITTPQLGWYSAKTSLAEPYRLFTLGKELPTGLFSSSKIKAFGTNGLAPARGATDKWGLIDTTGNWVVAAQFSNLEPFSEGLAAAEKDYSQWGFINAKGEWVIPPSFDRAGLFRNGTSLVEKGMEIGYINAAGQWLFRFMR